MKKLMMMVVAAFSAACALADSFPAPVEGVMTIDISSDVTYTEALPSTVTKLIKTGTGKAILTVDSLDFAGAVDVRQGTLQVNTLGALGTPLATSGGSKLTVSASAGPATLHFYKPPVSTAGSQSTLYYSGHDITISGAGVDGKGAFIYTPQDSNNYDKFFDQISLGGDATICVPSARWGVCNALNLNGHTLTRIGTGGFVNFSTVTVNGGTFHNKEGLYTMQTKPNFTEPEKTSIFMEKGELRFWRTGRVDVPVTFVSGTTMRSGANNSGPWAQENENVYAGGLTVDLYRVSSTVTITNRVYADIDANTWMIYECPLVLKTTLAKTLPGLLRIKNDIVGSYGDVNANIQLYGYASGAGSVKNAGTLVFEGDHDRTFHDLYTYAPGDVKLTGGTLSVRDFVLQATGGRFLQSAGDVTIHGTFRAGQALGINVFRMTGGSITNTLADRPHFGVRADSSGVLSVAGGRFVIPCGQVFGMDKGCWGMLVQTGGVIRPNQFNSTTCIGMRGDAFAYVGGGTYDSYHNQYAYTSLKISEGGGKAQLVISGSDTVFKTDVVEVGCATNAAVNVLALVNGGSLRAMRFYKRPDAFEGSHFSICADNGVLMPTWTGGWCHKNPTHAEYASRAPDAFPIFSGGLTIDTSECCGDDRKTVGTSYMNFAFSAPEGKRITSITLPTSAAFLAEKYFSEKRLEIEGPSGSFGACAYVDFDYDNNALGQVKLLCGGCNYDDTTKIYIRSADQTKRYECTYTLDDQLPGGGLTKKGVGDVALYRANTYTGATRVLGGTLYSFADGVIPANTALEIAKGASLYANNDTVSVSSLCGQGSVTACPKLTLNGPMKITLADLFADGATPLTVSGTVDFASGSEELEITDRANLGDYLQNDQCAFLSARSITGTVPRFVKKSGESDAWRVVRRGNKLYFGSVRGCVLIVK